MPKSPKRLKAYYGWAKLNKVQKRESLVVVFENEEHAGRSILHITRSSATAP